MHGLHPARTASVAIAASPGALAQCNNRALNDEMQVHVSLDHGVAVCLVRGTARTQDLGTETAVKDPVVMAFQDRVGDPGRGAAFAEVAISPPAAATIPAG